MKRIQLAFFLVLWLSLWANGASAQAAGNVSEEETLYNGVLSIEYECDGYGDFNPGDGTEDYAGVSIGNGSSEYGCSIAPPGGSYTHQSSGEFYGYAINPPIMYIPVTASGNWNYYASFFLWFWECDPESDP